MGKAGKPEWREIESALGAVLELPDHQRSAYLARQPESIRAEVEPLLAAYRRSGNLLSAGVGPLVSPSLLDDNRGPLRPAVTLQPGLQIGPYRIEALLGQGGMGAVYRALDTKLNRPRLAMAEPVRKPSSDR